MKLSAILLTTTLLSLLIPIRALSQSTAQPPSLQMGLNGLTFRPGTLDAELILEIIAEKQQELKKRAIKSLILRQVNQAGGSVYVFADNVLNAVITEKDNAIRTRNILENTVNLVFSMALTEYIRQMPNLKKNLTIIASSFPVPTTKSGSPATHYDSSLSFQRTLDTNKAENRSFLYTLDVVSEAIRTNKRLKTLGLMSITYPGEWRALNSYISDQDTGRKSAADALIKDVDNQLENLLDNIGFIENQITQGSFSFSTKTQIKLVDKIASFNHQQFSNTLDLAIQEAEKLLTTDTSQSGRLFREKNGESLAQYWLYLKKIKGDLGPKPSLQQFSDILFHITTDVLPHFEQLREFVPGVGDLYTHSDALRGQILTSVQFASTSTNRMSLMHLVAKLYQFKKAKTYSDYLNIMTDLPQLVGDPKVRSTLNTLLTFIKNYVTIKQSADNQELIDIDVESLLVMLQQYSQSNSKTVQFMFTVGANTAYRSVTLSDTVKNFAFVGEKFGLKIRLKDWSYLRSFNKYQTFYRHAGSGTSLTRLQPPQEPLVSNMHLLLYGSGILYNLVRSSNNANFRQPIIGTGLGVTFVNSIDVNLSANFPQQSSHTFSENFSNPFINLGLDILFTEYIDRLFKKRSTIKK